MNASSVDACSKLWPASQRRWSRFHVVGGVDDAAFAKLRSLLRYIHGDYSDPATFDALRRELGHAAHPLHYLAIPPSLFGTVVRELGRSHRRRFPSRDREAVRAQPRVGAGAHRTLGRVFPERSIFTISNDQAARGSAQLLVSPALGWSTTYHFQVSHAHLVHSGVPNRPRQERTMPSPIWRLRRRRPPVDDAYTEWLGAHTRCAQALATWRAAPRGARAAAYRAFLRELEREELAAAELARLQPPVAA